MAEDKSPDQQRRQSSSVGSLPVGRANDQGRRQPHVEDARSKAASSYALPCPPDSRRRLSRDVISKSLGAHDYRYVQHASPTVASVATGRASYAALGHYPQVAREYVAGPQHARGYGPREYQAGGYYVPEHPYVPGVVAYPAMGSYDWKASPGTQRGPELATPQDSKARQPVVTHVGMMHQAGDVAGPAATLPAKQQASPGQNGSPGLNGSPGEAAAESDWSPTKELLKEDSRSAVYYAGAASEGSSEHHDKPNESSLSSISSMSTSGSSESTAESEPPQQPVPSQHSVPIDQAPPPPQVIHQMQKMQEMQQMQQMQHMREHMQPQQFHQPQPARQQDDPQKPAPQHAPRIKDIRVDTAGRVASVLPVPPVGPPPGYFARPSREPSSSRTKDTDSRSQFSVASLAAPLLPASAASLANRSAMEQACILVNVVLLSVLTGIVAAFLVRQLT
ncbi:uncharacterized protein [Dermacentor andersoni]|uniref:uncharacterized protein n=1 Tax=Dermacentor andersoni TaxID=34620 RepID=UPI003B3A1295